MRSFLSHSSSAAISCYKLYLSWLFFFSVSGWCWCWQVCTCCNGWRNSLQRSVNSPDMICQFLKVTSLHGQTAHFKLMHVQHIILLPCIVWRDVHWTLCFCVICCSGRCCQHPGRRSNSARWGHLSPVCILLLQLALPTTLPIKALIFLWSFYLLSQ